MSGDIRIGISGWTYAPWRGRFYPKGLAQKRELAFAAEVFGTIEINGTFYGLQTPNAFGRWADETPDGFIFSVKGSRYITHMLKLRNAETALANFFASGVLRLGPRLGPILWQFPAQMTFRPEVFETFLAQLPRTTGEAAAIARRHDARLKAPAWLTCEDAPMRHAFEIRHDSFRDPAFADLLAAHNAALVCADTETWPLLLDATADFVYCRLHGGEELYVSGYDDDALEVWAARARLWAEGNEPTDGDRIRPPGPKRREGRDVFVYFDNDVKVRAPADAEAMECKLGLKQYALVDTRSGGEEQARGRAPAMRSPARA